MLRTLAFFDVHPVLGSMSLHRCGVAHQPSLRSRRTMMTYANALLTREVGSLSNRTVTIRTKPRYRHPRTGSTALLLSSNYWIRVQCYVQRTPPRDCPRA